MRLWKIMVSTASATYKEWAAYRSHALVSLFVGPVMYLVQVSIWKAVYSGKDTLNGLSLNDMLVYYAVSALIFYIIMDFADWNLHMLIRTGKFLTFLLRPMSHRYFALSQKVGHRVLGFFVEFLPVLLLFIFVFKVKLMPAYPIWFIVSLLLGFLMMFLVNYCVGITGFWLTQAEGLRRVFMLFRDILAGSFIPLAFFPDLIQKLFLVLPFQFISYVPIRVFLGSYELAGVTMSIPQIVCIQAVAVLAMWGVSELLYRAAIKHFTGVGA